LDEEGPSSTRSQLSLVLLRFFGLGPVNQWPGRAVPTGRKMAEVLYNDETGEYVAPLVLEYPNK